MVTLLFLLDVLQFPFAIDNDLSRQYGALAMGIQGIAKSLGLEKQSKCYQSVTSGKNNHFQVLYIGPLKHHISNKHVFSVVLTDFFPSGSSSHQCVFPWLHSDETLEARFPYHPCHPCMVYLPIHLP